MIMFTITPLLWICYNSRRSGKKIVALFKPWESLQIYTQYIHPTKHTPAWICFVLKGQYGQNNLQLVNQNQIRVVQQNQQQQGQIMMAPYSQSPQQQGQVMMAPYSQPPQQQGNMMRGGQQVGMQMQPQGQVMQVRQGQMIQPQGQVMQIRQGQMIQPQGPVIQGQMIQPQGQVIQGQTRSHHCKPPLARATPPLRHAPLSGKPTQRLSATRPRSEPPSTPGDHVALRLGL